MIDKSEYDRALHGTPLPAPLYFDEIQPHLVGREQRITYGYWQSLPRQEGYTLPSWKDFDPLAVPMALAHTMVLKVEDKQNYFMNILGEKSGLSFGIPTRRDYLQALLPPAKYKDMDQKLQLVLHRKTPLLYQRRLDWTKATLETKNKNYRMLFLPFSEAGTPPTDVGRILVVTCFMG